MITGNIKFNNWEYFKIIVLISIFSSIFFMKQYQSYGYKGEYILTEHGSESQSYSKIKVSPISGNKICNPNCAKDCQNKIKEGNFSIIDCLDSCACNDINQIQTTNNSNKKHISFYSLFICINIIFILVIIVYYQDYLSQYTSYILYRLHLIKRKKFKSIYIENEEDEDINEYKKLTDL